MVYQPLNPPQEATIVPVLFQVVCTECGELLTAPDTLTGRIGWTAKEIVPGNVHVCPRGHYVIIPSSSLSSDSV